MTHPHRSPDAPSPEQAPAPRRPGPARTSEPTVGELSVEVNGEVTRVAAGATVASLVAGLGLAGRKIAVAVNRDVVPRSAYAERSLAAGDRIEILEAVGGG